MCNAASSDISTDDETRASVTNQPRDRLPQLITDSAAVVPATQFDADEDNPEYSSPADHYDEINEAAVTEVWTPSNEDRRPPVEGPYEGLGAIRLDELPVETTPDVYVPLRRAAESSTSSRADANKRVRSLPTLGHLQDTV